MPLLELDPAPIYFEDVGAGAPIVLIHGAVSSGRCFEAHVELLATDHRVIVPDLRGMGRSERVTTIAPGAWTSDLLALVDHLGVERAHVCGSSLGARIALRLALDHPERVLSVAADSPILADSQGGAAALMEVFGDNASPEMLAQLEAWNGDDWDVVRRNFLQLRTSPGLQDHYDLRSRVDSLDCPLLVTRGDLDDPIHPLAHAVELHTGVGRSWLWIAPDTNFTAMRSRPAEFVEIYSRFLDSVGTSA